MNNGIGVEETAVAPTMATTGDTASLQGSNGATQRGVKPETGSARVRQPEKPEADETDGDEDLREAFVKALKAHSGATESLRQVISACVAESVDVDTMVEWGTEAGYSESYVRTTVSSILRADGVKRRKDGGGRKTSKDAQSLLAYARKAFGDKAQAMLRAATRLAEKEDKVSAKAEKADDKE